eukprot:scaffold82109_cov26-Tisochrysis_lutea.AAC.5
MSSLAFGRARRGSSDHGGVRAKPSARHAAANSAQLAQCAYEGHAPPRALAKPFLARGWYGKEGRRGGRRHPALSAFPPPFTCPIPHAPSLQPQKRRRQCLCLSLAFFTPPLPLQSRPA